MGDIHGGYHALRQCLTRSGFDFENDHLICLGDVCDGWPDTNACIDALLRIKKLTYILGNHDYWTLNWMLTGVIEEAWRKHSEATIQSYIGGVPQEHITFLKEAKYYHVKDNALFVHAGIDPQLPLHQQGPDIFLWNRSLAHTALEYHSTQVYNKLTTFDEVYIGHTPIPFSNPLHACEIWLMDTGAGWSGVLSMMDVESKEVFVSDEVPTLYPGVKARTKK